MSDTKEGNKRTDVIQGRLSPELMSYGIAWRYVRVAHPISGWCHGVGLVYCDELCEPDDHEKYFQVDIGTLGDAARLVKWLRDSATGIEEYFFNKIYDSGSEGE